MKSKERASRAKIGTSLTLQIAIDCLDGDLVRWGDQWTCIDLFYIWIKPWGRVFMKDSEGILITSFALGGWCDFKLGLVAFFSLLLEILLIAPSKFQLIISIWFS